MKQNRDKKKLICGLCGCEFKTNVELIMHLMDEWEDAMEQVYCIEFLLEELNVDPYDYE